MRKMMALGAVLCLAACGGNPDVQPKVTWGYGAGNGDSVTSSAPTNYSFTNGLGQDMPVAAGQMPKVTYGYGGDQVGSAQGATVAEQMTPAAQSQQQVAAPAPTSTHPAITPAPNSHL